MLQPEVLPVYRRPFPRSDEPRYIHGCAHVCRSLMFSEVLLSGWTSLFGFEGADRFAIRHAIAWHDAGREGDGADFWEEDSARLAAGFLGGGDYAWYVGSLIVKPGDAADPNAVVVTAVDSLDILRLIAVREFDCDRFPWLHPGMDPVRAGRLVEGTAELRRRVIEEAAGWVDETTGWQVRRGLEVDPRCFETLLGHLMERAGKYPTLAGALAESL